MIYQHSSVPIYTCWDIYNGLGAVGGLETSGYLQGETAANLALRILKGEKPSSIPVIEHSPKQYMFDYTQLTRFGINPDLLPQGSIVINRPVSFYEENRGKVWAVNVTILVLVVMIVSLIINIQRRKKIEMSLRESEERFKSVVDNIAIGVSLISPEMKIIALNKQMREWFPEIDVSRHPVCYDSFNQPPRGEICAYCPTCQTLRDGQVHIAMTETPANDKVIYFRVVSSPIRDKNGEIISAVELVEDITERKKAEQALIASESKYRSLFEKMINGFALHRIILDDKGNPVDYTFLEANEAFERLTGLKRENIIGKRVTEVLSGIENEAPGWIKTYGEVALTGKEIRFENRSDLLGKWYSISAYSPMTNYFVTIFEDITEKKKMEDALHKSEERYRTIFEESKDVIFVSTPDGRYLDMNPAGLEIFGYSSREELAGVDISRDIYVNPEDRTKFQKELDEKGFVKDYEIEMKRKDGKPLTVLSTVTAVRNEQGVIVAYRGIRHDITEHKRLEQQLLQAQKMEAVGQLAGGVAHDFNNILTAIIGYSSLLQMKMSGDSPLNDYVRQILGAADKAAEVTKSLLAFSRKQMMNPRPVDLNDIVRSIEKLLSRLIGEDIEITTTLFSKEVVCMADAGQIEQVLMNLTTNARDAMPNGGRLTLKTEVVDLDDAFIQSHGYGEPGRYAVLSVSDTGMGINQETKEKIFEPFFTTKEVGKGTGLGLAMVYGIVKQHGGHINVYSETGKGTIFKIYLPAAQSKEESLPGSFTETQLRGGSETILVAEDDEKLRQLSEIILTQNGYRVISAQDGEDAVNKFIGHKDEIQLVIVDMIMPKKSGKEAYDEIKAVRPDIKVLFLSGYAGDRVDLYSLSREKLSFINKPVSPKDLLSKVREILDK